MYSMVLLKSFLSIKGQTFYWGSRTYIMGIINVTEDSFSGDGMRTRTDGKLLSKKEVIEKTTRQAVEFVNDGADILDIGGESTRPGAHQVSIDDELDNVIPIIETVSKEVDVVISIDTYKAEVAEAALTAGADMINDVWGLKADQEMALVASAYKVPIILMHNRSSWAHAEIKEKLGGRYIGMDYENLLVDINSELKESISIAKKAGVSDEYIIIDPGIGFGKTVEQNLELVNRLDEIRSLGYPLLFGPSRKSFIGYTLDLPPEQRVEGTAAAVSIGIDRGADIIRVHDVKIMKRTARMVDAIVRHPSKTS